VFVNVRVTMFEQRSRKGGKKIKAKGKILLVGALYRAKQPPSWVSVCHNATTELLKEK
jgi:hypothetical protein